MVLKVTSLHLPHKTTKRLKNRDPQQWVGRLWNWDKSHRHKNLLHLLKAVVTQEKLKTEPQAQELAQSCFNKLSEYKNKFKKQEKKEFSKLEPKYNAFKDDAFKHNAFKYNAFIAEKAREKELCPITLEEIVDPVITPCGHKYERLAIEQWLLDHWECPVDRRPLFAYQLKRV